MNANPLPIALDEDHARVVGHVKLTQDSPPLPAADFLTELAANPWSANQIQRDVDRVLAEIRELQTANRWDDILALFHPVAEKLPELVDSSMENEIQLKIGFVLCRAGRHAEAVACLEPVVRTDTNNGMAHYTLAYTALDALFTARGSRHPLPWKEKKRLLLLGHTHFQESCRICPDSVTFSYRHAVLFKEIENKPYQAIPLFERAIANWEQKDEETRKKQHQQYPKYIKAMYHLASCLLKNDMPARSHELLEKVIRLDQDKNYMAPVFKHFAMGKVLHALGESKQALEHLELAAHRADKQQATDFVFELAARCALVLQEPERAARYIQQVPKGRRRPYVSWTEADVLVAQGQHEKALRVLAASAERDRRSRHKALIRMARIALVTGDCVMGVKHSREAAEFCRTSFGNPSHEALFWQAASLYRLERFGESLQIIEELEQRNFRFPNFKRLAGLVRQGKGKQEQGAGNKRLALVQ